MNYKHNNQFIEIGIKHLPEDVLSETFHIIYGHKFRCVRKEVFVKNKRKIQERWFCLAEGEGKHLPEYIREGAQRTGFKSFKSFFAMAGYYRSSKY